MRPVIRNAANALLDGLAFHSGKTRVVPKNRTAYLYWRNTMFAYCFDGQMLATTLAKQNTPYVRQMLNGVFDVAYERGLLPADVGYFHNGRPFYRGAVGIAGPVGIDSWHTVNLFRDELVTHL